MSDQLALFPEVVVLTRCGQNATSDASTIWKSGRICSARTLLIRRWGRIRTSGRQRHRSASRCRRRAPNALALLAHKRRRGYREQHGV